MTARTIAAATALALGFIGCIGCGGRTADPRPQWVLEVTTDAPVPQFGDRLLIEVLDPSGKPACPGCARHLGVTAAEFPVSFGVVPAGPAPRVRVRLFRAVLLGEGVPTSPALIDYVGVLPEADEVTHVEIPLRMSCFGVASDLTAHTTCDPALGASAPEVVLPVASASAAHVPGTSAGAAPGSWSPTLRADCDGPTPDGMACIPGAAFLLGSPGLPLSSGLDMASDPGAYSSTPEHVVTLDAYFLDVDEMTVGTYQQALALRPDLGPALPHTPAGVTRFCSAGLDDALPINCLTWTQADGACAALGKRLPTEAEWELAAGNREAETTYPWGNDPSDICAHAVVARDDGLLGSTDITLCRKAGQIAPGPVAGGLASDVTALGVRNLAGNLSEWVADDFQGYAGACFAGGPILHDPTCGAPQALASARGGNYASLPSGANVTARASGLVGQAYTQVGLRCAR